MKTQPSRTVLEFDLSLSDDSDAGVLKKTFEVSGDLAGSEGSHDTSTVAMSEANGSSSFFGVVVGKLVDLDESAQPLVDFPGNPIGAWVRGRSTSVLSRNDVGREVVVLFEEGELQKPIVIGFLQRPNAPLADSREDVSAEQLSTIGIESDGDRLVVTADKEIVLRCGEASITLTRAGKVLIRGTYLLSRSSGVNQIKGGSVHIN
jgi:hypothetical protein